MHAGWQRERQFQLIGRTRAALEELCANHRRSDGHYDCVVPGSGGKDSFFASHILKNKFDMNPLTVTWAPNIYTEWGWRNFNVGYGHAIYAKW